MEVLKEEYTFQIFTVLINFKFEKNIYILDQGHFLNVKKYGTWISLKSKELSFTCCELKCYIHCMS